MRIYIKSNNYYWLDPGSCPWEGSEFHLYATLTNDCADDCGQIILTMIMGTIEVLQCLVHANDNHCYTFNAHRIVGGIRG